MRNVEEKRAIFLKRAFQTSSTLFSYLAEATYPPNWNGISRKAPASF